MTAIDGDFAGKTVVIKLGGNVFTGGGSSLSDEVQGLLNAGARVVIVHGGGASIDAAMEKAGLKPVKFNGLRITNSDTLNVVVQVLDAANCTVSSILTAAEAFPSVRSVIKAAKAKPVQADDGTAVDLGFVGEVVGVDSDPLFIALAAGKVPVIAPIGYDDGGGFLNINADHAAAAVAVALGASWLLLLSDVPGVLSTPGNAQSVLPQLDIAACKNLVSNGTIKGGMVPKVHTAISAVEAGVSNVVIADGLAEQAVEACLRRRRGTVVTR